MALHQRYNNENLLIRSVIAGLLNVLNNKISYKQVWSNDDIETVNIPWYYNMSGDERFMQDFYTHYAHCLPPKPVDGNFDMVPRGIITYTGSPIDAERITSRFIQGRHTKEINGTVHAFRSFIFPIPLSVSFDCELWLDNQVTAMKVEQEIREVFYKTVTFYVYYKGMRVGCTAGFPETITMEKNISYSFESINRIKITFSIEIETYQPVFDNSTETPESNKMKGLAYRLETKPEKRNDGIIMFTPETESALKGITIPSGSSVSLEWDYIDYNSIINKVDILWSDIGKTQYNDIERFLPNNEYYWWNIPADFTGFKQPEFMWPESGNVQVYREPIVRVIPNIENGIIDSSSFRIIDSGYFRSPNSDASCNIVLEMKDESGNIIYTGDSSIYFVLEDNKIKEFVVPENDVIYPAPVLHKIIDIHLKNSVSQHEKQSTSIDDAKRLDVITNVTIV